MPRPVGSEDDDPSREHEEPYQREEHSSSETGPYEEFPRSNVVADLQREALQGMPFEELLGEACKTTADVLDIDFSHVFQLRPEHGDLILRAGVSWPDEYIDELTIDAAPRSQTGYPVQSWEPTVVRDIREEERFEPSEVMGELGIRSGVTVVIPSPSTPWGVFGAHSSKPRAFEELDTTFVQSMGQVLSGSISMKHANEEKERYKRRLEHFAHTASHDLQEPLRMVTNYLSLIEDRYGDKIDEEGQELFQHAESGAHRMATMIQSLLRFAEVTTGAQKFERVDANAAFKDARSDLDLQVQEEGAEVIVETLPTVRADPDQLSQVFQNLVSNALKYSGDDPPKVHVFAKRRNSDWCFSVRDEGIGIPPEHKDDIFDIFHRLEEQEDEEEGTGIGLAICEQIIDRHGGRMWVESEPGEGATFSFTLPALDEE